MCGAVPHNPSPACGAVPHFMLSACGAVPHKKIETNLIKT